MNLKIKYRESFRPFAPAVLCDRVTDYFDIDVDSPYMLIVADVKKSIRLPMNNKDKELFGIEKLKIATETEIIMQFLVYDIETLKLADQVGGWGNKFEMGISSIVIYKWPENEFIMMIGGEGRLNTIRARMKELFQDVDYIIGFNNIEFDYKVLFGNKEKSPENHIDLLKELRKVVGRFYKGLKLTEIAKRTIDMEKNLESGIMAPQLFADGDYDRLLEYNLHDVRMTWNLFVFWALHGCLRDAAHRVITIPKYDWMEILQDNVNFRYC